MHVRDGARWAIYTNGSTKGTAPKSHVSLLSSGNFGAVKVTEDRVQTQESLNFPGRSIGQGDEKNHYNAHDEAPLCEKIKEFHTLPARKMMADCCVGISTNRNYCTTICISDL
jgi:hypothetical protein